MSKITGKLHGTPRQEAGAVAGAALGLTIGMAIGSSLAGHTWLAVLGTALWAAAAAAVYAVAGARPPGIVMPVLVCSVGTGLPPGDTARRAAAVAAAGVCAAVLSWLVARVLPTDGPGRPGSVTGGAGSATGGPGSVTGGADSATGGPGSVTGGAGSVTGGAGSVTGGAGSATGGAGSATGGPGSATGGPGSATGGPGSATGGPGSVTGGAGSATGGPGSVTGGAGSATGGAGSVTSRPGSVTGRPGIRLRLALVSFPRSPFPWMAARVGAAVALAGSASLLCQVGRPYWAMAAAAAVLARGSHAAGANARAVLRGTGTAAGCVLAGALASAHPRGVAIALLLAALTFVIELVVARNYAVAMVFVTPLSVLLVTSATGASAVLTITADRLLETVLGCLAAAVAGQLVTRRWAVRHRRHAVTAVLTASARLVEDPASPLRRTELDHARTRLRLVGERTAGERRGIRTATSALDQMTSAALTLAGRLLDHPDDILPDAAATAVALRRLAELVDPCVTGAARRTDTALPPLLTEVGTALDTWLAGSRHIGHARRG